MSGQRCSSRQSQVRLSVHSDGAGWHSNVDGPPQLHATQTSVGAQVVSPHAVSPTGSGQRQPGLGQLRGSLHHVPQSVGQFGSVSALASAGPFGPFGSPSPPPQAQPHTKSTPTSFPRNIGGSRCNLGSTLA